MSIFDMQSLRIACIALLLSAIAACGGGSGAAVQQTPPTNQGNGNGNQVVYKGPAPATADVQQFKLNVWDNLVTNDRCGQCHGTQVPAFVRTDDINLAYDAANTVIDLKNPAGSRMVQKVSGGHNCWLSSASACGDVLTRYIQAWATASTGGAKTVNLVAPPVRDPGASKAFPPAPGTFATTVHPLLTQYCAGCHSETAQIQQQPLFASADVDSAYAAAKAKMNLDNPADSRFVVRLRSEFHNCPHDCAADSTEIEDAIRAFAGSIPTTQVDPQLVLSKALRLHDGVIASSGGRFESNVVALWEFKTGSGATAFDTSGISPAIDLSLIGDVTWVGGYGIRVANKGRAQGTTSSSAKLQRLIGSTGEYSVEAWVAPANVTQDGPARIVSYSGGSDRANFTMGQTLYNYDFLARSSKTGAAGTPALSTADDAERLQATLQHVVMTYDPTRGRRIYVNGEYTGDVDAQGGGTLSDWDDTFAFVLGNEVGGDKPWSGVIRLVAIHNRALTDAQIQQNFNVGVGERYFLLFGVGSLINTTDAYVLFEVEQFDSYSYLFSKPRLVVLNGGTLSGDIPLKGMRIGINGQEAAVGQAYSLLDTTIHGADLTADGIPIATVGTVIALDKGVDADEFFLTFDQIGTRTYARSEPATPQPTPAPDLPEQSQIGVRNFAEINATMSALTTVPATDSRVLDTYNTVIQQLPTVERFDAFGASNQMGVTQLAISYCDALVETPALAAAFFPGLNLAAPPSTELQGAQRNDLINPLMARLVGQGLTSQPTNSELSAELNNLIDKLTTCGNACPADRTKTVTKASCAAVLGSAALLVQ